MDACCHLINLNDFKYLTSYLYVIAAPYDLDRPDHRRHGFALCRLPRSRYSLPLPQ